MMQTFLPYSSFERSAKCLDYRRLGKQRVEAMQILNALHRGGGWSNHTATRMWRGYEPALRQYMRIMIEEWVRRGYKNTMKIPRRNDRVRLPWWIGNRKFHRSHKSNLLRKDPEFYGKYRWNVTSDLPYFWPE